MPWPGREGSGLGGALQQLMPLPDREADPGGSCPSARGCWEDIQGGLGPVSFLTLRAKHCPLPASPRPTPPSVSAPTNLLLFVCKIKGESKPAPGLGL